MDVTVIRQKAKSLGIKITKKDNAELIKSIQKAEGNSPCFKSSAGSCGQMDCLWRMDCLQSN